VSNALGFSRTITGWGADAERKVTRAFHIATDEVQRSVVYGSERTGAPGQPVDTGLLRASWIAEFLSPSRWQLTTNTEYAPVIESNLRGATLKSKVGGFHSVKLTRAGWSRIVAFAAAEARGAL
jgi:hypothetical protein